jgi:hypothetical protein
VSKGDDRRPENLAAFKAGYERTFGKPPSAEEIQHIADRKARVLASFAEDQARLLREARLDFEAPRVYTAVISACCSARMSDWPDSDRCPKCGEHTTPMEEDDTLDRHEADKADHGNQIGIPCS